MTDIIKATEERLGITPFQNFSRKVFAEALLDIIKKKIEEHMNCDTYHNTNGEAMTCLDVVLSFFSDKNEVKE